MKNCPHCGKENQKSAAFCLRCGKRLPAEQTCPQCRRVNPADAQFCNRCSYAFGRARPVAAGTGLLASHFLLADRYRILRRVGEGGMGAVYEAEDTRLVNKQVAVKEMSDAALTDPVERAEALASFKREAEFLASLDHPNLPKVTDSFADGGKQYLVMEFVDGQTLEEVVAAAGRPLPEKTVLQLGVDLCQVLMYLHGRQPPIIFRDLKPANIMIDRSGMVKLIDFGIARHFTPGKSRDTTSLGTKGYAAPEQYGKGQTDARSDIYGLGATLHFLLTCRDPADDPLNFRPVRELNAAVSRTMNDAIMRAVATNPADRWPSAREMRRALTGMVGQTPQAAPTAVPTTRAPAKPMPPPAPPPRPVSKPIPAATPRARSLPVPSPSWRPSLLPVLRDSWWTFGGVVVLLSALSVLLQQSGVLGALFPFVWFTFSMLAGVLVRQTGAIALTWLSIPLYNSMVGQPNLYTWTEMLSLIVPIELFFLLTGYKNYDPLMMLLAGGLGVLGLWWAADLGFDQLALAGGAVGFGSVLAYFLGQTLEPLFA